MEDFKIKYKFLHTKPIKQKQIAQKMYADEFQSINNRQNILDFLKRVAEDGRFEELAMELGLTNCQTSNEEKAKEIAHDYFRRGQLGLVAIDTESAGYDCAMQAMKWKDKQESLYLNFISVKDRLPELRECVLVFGVLDASIPIFNSDGERIYHPDKVFDVWFNKRTEPSEHTDGNGFLLLKFHEEYKITHWFPIPKLDGKELYERI